jgi:hypothetical protein
VLLTEQGSAPGELATEHVPETPPIEHGADAGYGKQ